MESHDEDHAAKLLRTQTHVWNYSLCYMKSVSLKCVIELGIPDAIHSYGKPMPLSNLIVSLQIHPSKTQCVHRLMRFMIHSGFFSQHNVTENELEVAYALTDASALLLKNHPMSMAPLMQLDDLFTKTWAELPNWFKTDDRTSFETAHGMSFWEYSAGDPKLNDLFNEAMVCDTRLVTSLVVEKCKEVFMGLESLVDVGGGIGTMAKAIAKSFPHIQCTVLDQPHVIAGLQETDNLKYVGGNMFEAIPPADAIFFKWVLHNWNDENVLNTLKKCKEAITRKGKKGKVIIIDIVIDNEKRDEDVSMETQLLCDMLMMVKLNGKERNKKEWVKLISCAGFSDYKISPVLGVRSLIEIYP